MTRGSVDAPSDLATWTCVTTSADATWALGRTLGACLAGGETVALNGELGLGKTRLVQGIAVGLGISPDRVTSPTFALRHDHLGRHPLVHLDFYRLNDADEIDWLGVLEAPEQAVLAIEWADKLPEILPSDRLTIRFAPGAGPDDRTLMFAASGSKAARLLSALKQTYGA
jgi:tRNA threonylcarbamoyladenosine biosynthesis protein TsaE